MKKWFSLILVVVLLFSLAACSTGNTGTTSSGSDVQTSSGASTTSSTTGSTTSSDSSGTSASSAVAVSTPAASAADALIENGDTHDDPDDYVWDEASVSAIQLNGDSISASADGVTVDGSTVTITVAGTYQLSGSLSDGQVVVNSSDDKVVRLILNGVNINSSSSAPIYVSKAEEVIIVLADGTENTLTDGANYVYALPEDEEPNATIFSKADLTISGNGALTVNANFNDAISSKDGLVLASGTITVNSVDDGIRGKDYLVIKDGTITVNAAGDGLKSDNEEDAERGYISVAGGQLTILSGGDAINAQTDVLITGGQFNITTGGGSNNRADETTSAKGIKGAANVNIDGGTFTINAADDTIHTNGNLVINGGTFTLASADDGLHADATLEINGGDIQITQSYEGVESAIITVNNGTIHVVSSDDGFNGAGGNDGSGTNAGMGMNPGGGPGQDAFAQGGNYYIYINGGTIYVDANGDGLDVNGSIEMTNGIVIVNGPTEQMNGALDYDGSFKISGGFLVAVGSAGMAMAPDQTSTQNSVLINMTAGQSVGTLFSIQSSDGQNILTFASSKAYQSVAVSSPNLTNGTTYTVYTGGSASGTATDGLYQDGTYTPGTQYANFTVSSVVTLLGNAGMGGGRPGGGGGGHTRP